ncbi:Acyl-CoA:lysophosphatidylglycerol acyltransferase 1 [Rhizoclosmatium sp. JEL0117]|nr:Acyl-CoA:lysophosphatidylglycerol acyltransferase 1 [Rhizoclosmatium sp. JEL0117]
MLRPAILIVGSVHINIIQAPSLLLLPLSKAYDNLLGTEPNNNPFAKAFVIYNWLTQRLFASLLVLAHWSPFSPLELVIYNSDGYTADMFTGEPGFSRCVLMSNHQTQLDWMYLWLAAWYSGKQGSLRIVLKEGLKWIPVFGWGMHFFSFVFVSRDWEKDQKVLVDRAGLIRESSCGWFWLLVFPEGTIISPDTLEKSRKFAKDMAERRDSGFVEEEEARNILVGGEDTASTTRRKLRSYSKSRKHEEYVPTRVLIPRYRALWTMLRVLAQKKEEKQVQALLDVTMAYEPLVDVTEGVYPEKVYSPKNVYLPNRGKGMGPPTRVHIGVQTVYRNEWIEYVKGGDEKGFDAWLKSRWQKKEGELEMFQQLGSLSSSLAVSKGRKKKRKPLVVRVVPSLVDIAGLGGVILAVWIGIPFLVRSLLR